jgi:hypothetical protein
VRDDENDAAGLQAGSDLPEEVRRLKQMTEHVDHHRGVHALRRHVGGTKDFRADAVAPAAKILS